jgi:hypothetical protein
MICAAVNELRWLICEPVELFASEAVLFASEAELFASESEEAVPVLADNGEDPGADTGGVTCCA